MTPHASEAAPDGELFTDAEWRELVSELRLTDRQAEVVRLILRGQNDHQIASALGIARPTVRVHVRRAFEAVGVSDRTTLVIAVFRAFRRRHPEQWGRRGANNDGHAS